MPENGMDRQTYLDNKFGSAAAAVYGRIAAAGLESGIEFNFDKIMRTPDSRKAHQLLLSGAPYTDRLSEALYQAYFIDGKDIGNDDSLNDTIKAAGIKIDPAVAASSAIRKQLENDLFMARQLQLDGVPYFIFAEQFAVAGAHMPEHLIPVIDAAAA
jgi:predicted DsbA family dithiol-disulfide isomerase